MTTEVYSLGLTHASVCSNDGRDKAAKVANKEYPTGLLKSKWKPSKAEHFATGERNGCPCEKRQGFFHYLLEC